MGSAPPPPLPLRHRGITIAVIAALTACALLPLGRLSFDFSPQHLFEIEDGALETRRWRETVERFGRGDNLLFLALDAGAGGDALTPEVRAYLRSLSERLAAHPDIAAVTSLATTTAVWNGPAGLESGAAIARPRAALLSDPLIAGTLVSADGRALTLLVEVADHARLMPALSQLVDDVEARIRARPPPSGCEVVLAGIPFVRVDIVRTLQREQLFYMPSAALLAALFLILVTRRLLRSLAALAPVAVALLWSAGLAALFGVTVNIVNHVLPILIIVIGVSDALHLVIRDEDERAAGLPPAAALSRTTRALALACLFTSVTTAIGFASLAATRTPVVQEFGLLCAVSVLLAYAATICLLPPLLSLLPDPGPRSNSLGWIARAAVASGRLACRRPAVTLAAGLLLALLALGLATRIEADIHLMDYFPEGHANRRAQQLMEERLGGSLTAELIVRLPQTDADLDPEVLARLARVQQQVARFEGVTLTRSVADLAAAIHRAVAGRDALTPLPGTRQLAAQERLLAELAGVPLPIDQLVADDGRTLRIHLRTRDIGGRAWLEVSRRIQAEAEQVFADLPSDEIFVTGDSQLVSRNTTTLIRDLVTSLTAAIGLIFFCLLILLRSARLAAVALLPNALPLLLTAGVMGLAGINLDVSNAVIFSISIGLAVDDTIHMLARFREERQIGGDIDAVIERTLAGSGKAVILTSAVLAVGMALLLTSAFVPTRSFGLLTGITLVAALLADLLLLPALLRLAYGNRRPMAENR